MTAASHGALAAELTLNPGELELFEL